MRITGWSIDGFGQFHKAEVTDLPPGLIVVHGPNESGKTTLQHFLTAMLFGVPPKNSPAHHKPLRGGSHGGRLFVFLQWAFAYFTYQRSIRLITGEEAGPPSSPSSSAT